METITITAKLGKLALWYDYVIVCDEIKLCENKLELTNPIEYERDTLLKKYDGDMEISRWEHTFTENGEPAIAVVIEK